jgi:hypothetical protein
MCCQKLFSIRIMTMKISTLFRSAALLGASLFFVACGGSSGTEPTNSEAGTNETGSVRDSFPTTGLIDLKEYIPQSDKNVTFLVTDSDVNVNGEAAYTTSDGVITVESTHDGLDLDDYVEFERFISLDSAYREARFSMEFGSNYLAYTRDREEHSIPRFYDNNDSVTMTLQFRMTADFSVTTESGTVHYTDAYEGNASVCSMFYVGDYNISGNQYADAIRMSCFGNRSKGGSVDGVETIAYDYNYTSTTIMLPAMGIVSVDYESPDANYTIRWQP